MAIDKQLDRMDDLLESALNLPLTGGKCLVDVEKAREIMDDIRLNLPQEIKDAKNIVADREQILTDARREAEDIVKRAEARARQLVSDDEIVKAAQAKATKLLTEATAKTREMERAALDFSENSLKKSEDVLLLTLQDIKTTRQALRTKSKRPSATSVTPHAESKK